MRIHSRHTIGGIESQMNATTWDYYLHFEEDTAKREYLKNGIVNGFSIVDMEAAVDL